MTREEFVGNFENWDNYKPLLWMALEETDGDVLELGIGDGSTEKLHLYCEEKKRRLVSYESNYEWFTRFEGFDGPFHKLRFVGEDWDMVNNIHKAADVVFIDHAPGERRHIDVELFANKAKIIVIHDSEPEATGYMLDKVWGLFKYRLDYKTRAAWTTAVSNFIDVSKWAI